jgi:DNA-directed RNA polymerase II subunit RPB2
LSISRSAAFLKERLFDQSDAYRVHVCERSGLIAVANLKKQTYYSQIHKTDSSIVQVGIVDICLFHLCVCVCVCACVCVYVCVSMRE